MNRKQLLLLLIVGLVVGGLGYYLFRSDRAEFVSREVGVGEKLLGDFPANDVARLTVRSGEGEVNLAKDEVWVVREKSDYPASFSKVAELVRKLWDLKPVQSQNVGTSQWGRLNLLPPGGSPEGTNTATLIELKDKEGKTIKSILLGKQQMRDSGSQFGGFPVGRWVALPDNTGTVYVVNEAFSDVTVEPRDWLAKDNFFKVEKLKAISLVSTNADDSWALFRTNDVSGAPWTLVDPREGESLDSGKVSSFNWALSSPSFNDAHKKDSEEVKDAFAHPTTLNLETFDGFKYVVQIGSQPDPDSYYLTVDVEAELPRARVIPEDEKPEDKEAKDKEWTEAQEKLREKLKKEQALKGWVFKVSKWSVDSLLKNRGDLLAPKTETSSETSSETPESEPDDSAPALEPPPLPEGLAAPEEE
jgi:hypothetical protein